MTGSFSASNSKDVAGGSRSSEGLGGVPEFTSTTSDYLIITLLATGLARIKADRARRDADRGVVSTRRLSRSELLPSAWRAGSARLWWRFQQAGAEPPGDDLALFALCRMPFVDWPVQLDLSVTDRDACLVEDDGLSELALEAAKLGIRDVEADFVEEQTFAVLKAVAEMNASTEEQVQGNYERLRRLLIDQAVISDKQVRALMREFPVPGTNGQPYVQTLVETAYERRQASDTTVVIACCGGCGNPLAAEATRCGTAGCAGSAVDHDLRVLDAYYVQHRGVRRYIHDAGLLEVRLHDTLRTELVDDAVLLRPWPGLDAFDLLVAFLDPQNPDPERPVEMWGADGKDHASPSLLAIGFRWTHTPRCDRRFLVLPMHRARQPGYVRDLETELEGRDSGVRVVDEETFVRRVIARSRELSAS